MNTGRAARRLGAEDAAARLHHEQLRLDARVREPALDPLEVALDDRPDDGVDDGRGRAQVLAELGRDLGRERDRDARQLLGEDRADPPLVLRVDVRVEQADRDRLDLLAPQDRGRLAHRVLVERPQHLAGRAEPLADLDGAVARHERRRLLELRVVERRAHLAGDLEQVAEALGRDEAAARDLALDDRVRRDRRRVHDEADLRGRRRASRERALDGVHEALRGSAGVVSTFAIATAPVSSSMSVASVNVPPMSIARRTLIARSPSVARLVDAPVVDRDAVDVARALGADLALEHVAQHPLRVALLGRAVAAAAAGADADHVAGDEVDGRLRREPRLDAVADVHVLGRRAGVAAERAPRARRRSRSARIVKVVCRSKR